MAKTTSKPLPFDPETCLTLLATSVAPDGVASTQSAAVNVEKFIARSNVTRTLVIAVALGPIATLPTIFGALTDSAWAVPTAAVTLGMPPVATLPARAVDLSAVPRIWPMTCLYVHVGFFDHTRATAPV